MSYGQYIGDIGGTANPLVMKECFAQVLRFRGQAVELFHGPTTVDCECIDEHYKSADENCTICKGTGSISGWTENKTFLAAVFIRSEMRQDQHQRLITRGGPIETYDATMYCEAQWFNFIHVGDVVVFKEGNNQVGVEMQVINKLGRLGNYQEIVYIRCDLEKQPTSVMKPLAVTTVRDQL